MGTLTYNARERLLGNGPLPLGTSWGHGAHTAEQDDTDLQLQVVSTAATTTAKFISWLTLVAAETVVTYSQVKSTH